MPESFIVNFNQYREFLADQPGPKGILAKLIFALFLTALSLYLHSQVGFLLRAILYLASVHAIFRASASAHHTFFSAYSRWVNRYAAVSVDRGVGLNISWQTQINDKEEQVADTSETVAKVSLSLHDTETQQRFTSFEQEERGEVPAQIRKPKRWHTAPSSPLFARAHKSLRKKLSLLSGARVNSSNATAKPIYHVMKLKFLCRIVQIH